MKQRALLEAMQPRDISRAVSHFSRARVLHTRFLDAMVNQAALRAKQFRALEMAELLTSMRVLHWQPSDTKLRLIGDLLVSKTNAFTISQAAEVLHSLAALRGGTHPNTRRVFTCVSQNICNLDALCGQHSTPKDIANMLHSHATVRATHKPLFSIAVHRLTTLPNISEQMHGGHLTRIMWAIAVLSEDNPVCGAVLAQGRSTVEFLETAVLRFLSTPDPRGNRKRVSMLWSLESLKLFAEDDAKHVDVVEQMCRGLDVSTMRSWDITVALWSLVQGRVVYVMALEGGGGGESRAYFIALIKRLCARLVEDYGALSVQSCSSVTWSLAALKLPDKEVFACIIRHLVWKKRHFFYWCDATEKLIPFLGHFWAISFQNKMPHHVYVYKRNGCRLHSVGVPPVQPVIVPTLFMRGLLYFKSTFSLLRIHNYHFYSLLQKESNWAHLSSLTGKKLVELLCSFAEAGFECTELQYEVARHLHSKKMSAPVAVQLGWALATSKQPNSTQVWCLRRAEQRGGPFKGGGSYQEPWNSGAQPQRSTGIQNQLFNHQ